MHLTITPLQAALVFISLLAMYSPPASLGPIAAILRYAPREVQHRLAWRIARNYAIVLLLAVWIGQYLLLLLGISAGALTATGGAALLHQGLPLMTSGSKAEESEQRVQDAAGNVNWDQLAVVPLLFPLAIGGGTIAVAVAAGGRYPSWADLGVLSLVILTMVPIIAGTILVAAPVSGKLSEGAQDVLARVSGIILVAISIQLLIDGLSDVLAATRLGVAILGLPAT
ncbi:MAG: MarC family protein [Burkholderiaceae bacterium]